MTWSRHSRRIDPITRSAYGFCHGLAGLPWLQRSMIVLARTSGEAEAAAGVIRHAVWTIDDQLPLYNVRSMEELRAESSGDGPIGLALVGTFAAIALALAAIGVYGVMAFLVEERSREIGIRLALGANPRDVLRMILRDGAWPTAMGVFIGLIATFVLTRMMQALLFETQPADPVTFATVAAVIALVAMLACFVPARRATRVDPLRALRARHMTGIASCLWRTCWKPLTLMVQKARVAPCRAPPTHEQRARSADRRCRRAAGATAAEAARARVPRAWQDMRLPGPARRGTATSSHRTWRTAFEV
jgi:hypothetical protein